MTIFNARLKLLKKFARVRSKLALLKLDDEELKFLCCAFYLFVKKNHFHVKIHIKNKTKVQAKEIYAFANARSLISMRKKLLKISLLIISTICRWALNLYKCKRIILRDIKFLLSF